MSREINLGYGKYAIVDDKDYEWLNQWRWYCTYNGYAMTRDENDKTIYMHRLINNTPKGLVTDHINGNKLDNRRINLRSCSQQKNNMNKPNRKNSNSQYKGVRKTQYGTWAARISNENGKRISLGCFTNEKSAAIAYNEKAKELYGEFAQLNDVEYDPNWRNHKFTSTSKYRGVTWNKKMQKWKSGIIHNSIRTHLGYFDSEIEAAKAYDRKAIELLGDKAKLNFRMKV